MLIRSGRLEIILQPLIQVYSIFKGIKGGMARVHSTHVKTAHYMWGLDPQMVHIKWPQLLQTAVHSTQHAALCTKSHLKYTLANYSRAKTKIIWTATNLRVLCGW